MVNTSPHRLLVTGECRIRPSQRGGERILNGPVYNLIESQRLLRDNGFRVINDEAIVAQRTKFVPELTDDELEAFFLALTEADFDGSERCRTSVNMTLDCDGYAMKWNRNTRRRWEHGAKYFLKYGFTVTGTRCVIVSIHPALR